MMLERYARLSGQQFEVSQWGPVADPFLLGFDSNLPQIHFPLRMTPTNLQTFFLTKNNHKTQIK